jgi:uncharacterized protein DUF3307
MTADPILTLAWLILAHLTADFILQTSGVVIAKTARDGRAWRGLFDHGLGVAACLVPVALAFGGRGVMALLAITLSHAIIDRIKVVATHRTEVAALAESRRRHEGAAPAAGLGRAWTPLPAAYFMLDQLAHLLVIGLVWVVWLAGTAPTSGWETAITAVTGGWDQQVVHRVTLIAVVVMSLLITNVRGGAIFVATLVRPLEVGDELVGVAGNAQAGGHGTVDDEAAAAPARLSWSIRIGPLAGRVVADAEPLPATPGVDATVMGERVALPPPARVGATIGVLERLLIVTFVLAGAEAAIGFVIAAKTIARFRQLDDRDFAEYYLLGTLASVSVAIVSGLVARAALAI